MPENPNNLLFITSGGVPDVVKREAESMMPNLGMGNYKPDFVEDADVIGLAPDAPERDWPPRGIQLDRKHNNDLVEQAKRAEKHLQAVAGRRAVIEQLNIEERMALREAKRTGYLRSNGKEMALDPADQDLDLSHMPPSVVVDGGETEEGAWVEVDSTEE